MLKSVAGDRRRLRCLRDTLAFIMIKLSLRFSSVTLVAAMAAMSGCASRQPVTMAPPVPPVQGGMVMNAPSQQSAPVLDAPPQSGGTGGGFDAPAPVNSANAGAFNWRDTPVNQNIPVIRAVFDQGGYQIFAQSGETIIVPFVNQNLYAMKFGQSGSGQMYFINDGNAPTLYLPGGGYLENAAAQGARWYPFSQNFSYSRPVYIGIAPSWADYVAMGWYSGMLYHGGYWGYRPWSPGFGYSPMIGLNFNIGGRPYYGWNSYSNYYRSNPYNRVYTSSRPSFNYSSVGRRSGSSFSANGGGRRSTGSFGGGSTYSRNPNYNGAFGGSRPSAGTGGSFGGSRNTFGTAPNRPGGSFGRSSSAPSGAFGRSGGSFGSAAPGGNSGFSSSGRSRGSFGSGTSGYSRPSGSFGGGSLGRSSGGGVVRAFVRFQRRLVWTQFRRVVRQKFRGRLLRAQFRRTATVK